MFAQLAVGSESHIERLKEALGLLLSSNIDDKLWRPAPLLWSIMDLSSNPRWLTTASMLPV